MQSQAIGRSEVFTEYFVIQHFITSYNAKDSFRNTYNSWDILNKYGINRGFDSLFLKWKPKKLHLSSITATWENTVLRKAWCYFDKLSQSKPF